MFVQEPIPEAIVPAAEEYVYPGDDDNFANDDGGGGEGDATVRPFSLILVSMRSRELRLPFYSSVPRSLLQRLPMRLPKSEESPR